MSEKGARIPFGDTSQGGPHGCGGEFAAWFQKREDENATITT